MMREKHRHILVEIYPEPEPANEEKIFWNVLSKEMMQRIGAINYHRANPKLVKFVGKERFIIKTTLVGVSQVIASLALIKNLDGRDVAFYTLKTSGTIKALLISP